MHNINTKRVSFFRLVEIYRYKIRIYGKPPTYFGPFRAIVREVFGKENTLMASLKNETCFVLILCIIYVPVS